MQVGTDLVRKLEALSKIELSQQEREIVSNDFEKILNYMDIISQLDISDIYESPAKTCESIREDTVRQSRTREDILKNAPQKENGFFVIPKAVE